MDTRSKRYDVAVVGGGLGGLAAATLVAKDGASVVLFERASQLGGRARSQQLTDAHRVNLGPHAIYRGGPALKVLRELGIDPRGGINKGEGAFGWREGRLHTLPSGPVSMLTTGLLRLPGRLDLVRLISGLRSVETSALRHVPLAKWLADTLHDADAHAVASTIFRVSTYCANHERLSAGAAIEQLRLGLQGVIYAHGGWQSVLDALEEKARAAGVAIVTGVRVERVKGSAADGAACELRLADGETVRARAVIIASDPAVVARLVDGEGTLGVARRLANLVSVRAACLDLALSTLPRPRNLVALGVDRPLYASVHSHWARLVEGNGAVVQLAKYLGGEGEPETGVEAELEEMMDALQPGWRDVVVGRRFLPNLTVMHALPTAELGGTAGRPPVEVAEAPGVYNVGDWVGPEGMLLDAVLSSARAAAERARDSAALGQGRRVVA